MYFACSKTPQCLQTVPRKRTSGKAGSSKESSRHLGSWRSLEKAVTLDRGHHSKPRFKEDDKGDEAEKPITAPPLDGGQLVPNTLLIGEVQGTRGARELWLNILGAKRGQPSQIRDGTNSFQEGS